MKIKQKAYQLQLRQQTYSPEKSQHSYINTIKSPSPDKQNSSILPNTPSPELKKNSGISSSKKEPVATTICKKIGQRERNYLNYIQNSEGKEQMAWIANLSSDRKGRRATLKNVEQTLRSQRNCEINGSWDAQMYEKSYSPSQLDYLRMIREKQQTIKQLRQILQQMDKNSIINPPMNEQKLKKAEKSIKEYQKQIKVLQIQNQCLINVIQSNQVNIPSNKEAIFQREIAELRESLKLKQEEIQQTRHCSQNASQKLLHLEMSNKQLLQENHELQAQCQKLLKIMKEKMELEKSKNDFGGYSELRRGEKPSLNLIKQQYNENLALMKSNFEGQVEKLSQKHEKNLQKANNKIDQLLRKIKSLQEKKEIITKRVEEETSSKKVNKKQENLEIQFLLQRFQKTEKDLQTQKSLNQKLSSQLQMAQQTLRSFQIRSFQASQMLESSDRIIKERETKILNQTATQMALQLAKIKEQNSQLKKELAEIQLKRQNQQKNFQSKLETVVICYENQLKDRRNSIEQKIRELQQNYMSQLESLNAAIQQTQRQNSELKRQREYWSDQYKNFSQLFQEQIKGKNSVIQQLQRQLQRVDEKAKQKRQQKQTKLNEIDFSIQGQLSKLKQDLQFLNNKILEQQSIISHYQALQVQLELKIQENHRLFLEIQSLRQDLGKLQKDQNQMSQKVVGLQKTIAFHDQALRERKLMYEQLYIGKTKIQKELILAQKIKLVHKEALGSKQPFKEMLQLIEKLLVTQKECKSKFFQIQKA